MLFACTSKLEFFEWVREKHVFGLYFIWWAEKTLFYSLFGSSDAIWGMQCLCFAVNFFLITLMQRKLEWFQYRFYIGTCTRNPVFGSFPLNEPIKPLQFFNMFVRCKAHVVAVGSLFVALMYKKLERFWISIFTSIRAREKLVFCLFRCISN